MVKTYLRRVYSRFITDVFDVPPRLLSSLFFLFFLLLPLTGPGPYLLSLLTSASVIAIFAASWDLLVGRTGQISLGHAIFLGTGAYASAFLYKFLGLPLWVTIPIAMLISVLVALLIGFPCLRVKGPYLALVTMAFPLIVSRLVYYFRDITGGEMGIRDLPRFFPFLDIHQQKVAEYYLSLLLLFVSASILYKIANSKTGIVFVSILDDELASKASGINTTKYKLMAFALSGLFASLAGGIYAHLLTVANPPVFSLTLSFTPVIVTILGGIGTIYGPIAASYIYLILDGYVLTILVRIPHEWIPLKFLIFVIVVVILIVKWPTGIARFVTDKLEDLAEERELEERGKWIWKKYKEKKSYPEG